MPAVLEMGPGRVLSGNLGGKFSAYHVESVPADNNHSMGIAPPVEEYDGGSSVWMTGRIRKLGAVNTAAIFALPPAAANIAIISEAPSAGAVPNYTNSDCGEPIPPSYDSRPHDGVISSFEKSLYEEKVHGAIYPTPAQCAATPAGTADGTDSVSGSSEDLFPRVDYYTECDIYGTGEGVHVKDDRLDELLNGLKTLIGPSISSRQAAIQAEKDRKIIRSDLRSLSDPYTHYNALYCRMDPSHVEQAPTTTAIAPSRLPVPTSSPQYNEPSYSTTTLESVPTETAPYNGWNCPEPGTISTFYDSSTTKRYLAFRDEARKNGYNTLQEVRDAELSKHIFQINKSLNLEVSGDAPRRNEPVCFFKPEVDPASIPGTPPPTKPKTAGDILKSWWQKARDAFHTTTKDNSPNYTTLPPTIVTPPLPSTTR